MTYFLTASALLAVHASAAVPANAPVPRESVSSPEAREVRNWFDDPFFRVSNALTACREPMGPRMTKSEMQREAHARTERGTRCYLEGRCTKPNSYHYDAEIAAELERRLANARELQGTSVWVTVQRRWVILQGCVGRPAQARALERIAGAVPDVERVIVELGSVAKPPYTVYRAPAAE